MTKFITTIEGINYDEARVIASELKKINGYEGLENQMGFLDNVLEIIKASKEFDAFEETTRDANGLDELKALSESAVALNGKLENEFTPTDWATRNNYILFEGKFTNNVNKAIREFGKRQANLNFVKFPESEFSKFLFGVEKYSKEQDENGKIISVKRKQNEDISAYAKSLLKKYFTK